MINLTELRKKVVHCPTEELIIAVQNEIVALGGRPLWDKSAQNYILYKKKQPTGMCFGLDGVGTYGNAYCDLEYYKKNSYDILTAEEFLRMCGKETIINNYQIY